MKKSNFRRAFFTVCCAVGAVLAIWRTFILKAYYNFETTGFDVSADEPLTAMKYILFALAAIIFVASLVFVKKSVKDICKNEKNYIANTSVQKADIIKAVVIAILIQAVVVIAFANIGDALTLKSGYAKLPSMSAVFTLAVILTVVFSEAYAATSVIGAISKKVADASSCVFPILISLTYAVGSQLNPYFTLRNNNRIIINIAVICVLLCCLFNMRSRIGRGLYTAHFCTGCVAAVIGIPAFVPEIIYILIGKMSIGISEACDIIMIILFAGEMITLWKITGFQTVQRTIPDKSAEA